MKISLLDRIVMAIVVSILSSAGISIAAEGERGWREEQKREQRVTQEAEKPRPPQKAPAAAPEPKQAQQQRERVQQKSLQEPNERRARQQPQQERIERRGEQVPQHVQQRRQEPLEQPGQRAVRVSQQRQQELIRQQEQRVEQYRRYLEQQERLARERAELLERQRRMAQYRFQQEYLERLRQQEIYLLDHRVDYDRDPYFYTAPIYRYNRGGNYYEINEYGARILRQAVNSGYEEGLHAGKADRDDGWVSNYEDCYAYRDANYGYNGYYVDRDDYNYYFREGFRRGYEDGYGRRYTYGRFADGSPSILETILDQILNFRSIS